MIYKYTIKEIPPSNNKYIGRTNYRAYQKEKKRWAELIFYTCLPRPTKPLEKSTITLTYYFKDHKKRDPDNYSGKFLMDGLVNAGILFDDSFNNIDLRLKQGGVDKENPRVEIEIAEDEK